MLVFSSSNWFTVWLSLEMSLLGFIPLFNFSSLLETEGLIKYFMVQAMGSSVFLVGVVSASSIIILAGFLLKLGMFPFFFWVPLVMASMTWLGCFVVSTIQKLPGMLSLFSPLFTLKSGGDSLIILSASLSVISGSIMGLNQSDMRNVMAYSSISQSSHLVICLYMSFTLFLIYTAVYFFISGMTFYTFDQGKFFKTKDVSSEEGFKINLLVLCLMGMPPLPIFYVKMFMLLCLVSSSSGIMVSIIFLASMMISSFFYLYLVMSSGAKSTTKIMIKSNNRIMLLLFSVSIILVTQL
uniref:NADH dehydrogenase subunit 2 n=1 Tax=Membranipora villosa TaxID=2857147 RepID=UPI002E792E39|nr:NADH dehydrogenase subunit 2 [Membranipora villosa]WQB41558.1 NADH dehydrogenase subunit 2 [Membranipora villosa]